MCTWFGKFDRVRQAGELCHASTAGVVATAGSLLLRAYPPKRRNIKKRMGIDPKWRNAGCVRGSDEEARQGMRGREGKD